MNFLVLFVLLIANLSRNPRKAEAFNPYNETFLARKDFLDRSDLIESLLNYSSPRIPYFTAPSQFGKTMILRMIQKYFEIETDSLHNTIPVFDTEAYWIFKGLKVGARYGDNETLEHLAQHPVIYLNFSQPFEKLFESSAFENVLYYMNRVVGSIFDDHHWLKIYCMQITNKEFRFKEHEIEFIEMANKRKLTRMDIVASLDMLVLLLYKYFQGTNKVVVLIDGLDMPLMEALASNADLSQETKLLYELITDMIMQTTRSANPYLYKMLMVGTSGIMFGSVVKNMTAADSYRFLDDHRFTSFGGFFESNLIELFDWYKCDDRERASIRNYYKAYLTAQNHTRVYNSYSIMKYFGAKERYNSSELKNYWIPGDGGRFINKFLNSYEFLEIFSKLRFDKGIRVELPDVDDSMTFELFLLGMESNFDADEFPFTEILVYFCLEQGYLTYTFEKNIFTVPSPEVRQVYAANLIAYFENIDVNLPEIGRVFGNFINRTSEDTKSFEKKFQIILTKQFAKVNGSQKGNFTQEYTFLSIISLAVEMSIKSDDLIDYGVDNLQQPVLVYKFAHSAIMVKLRDQKKDFSTRTLGEAGQRAIERKNVKWAKTVGINVHKDRSVRVQIVLVKV